MVSITEDEMIKAVEEMLNKCLEFPEANIDALYQIGSVFLTIGICKGSPSFKLLADHIMGLPSRLKPILMYSYQLTGAAGELREKYVQLVENSKQQFREAISNALQALSRKEIDESYILTQVDKLRTILTSLPIVTQES